MTIFTILLSLALLIPGLIEPIFELSLDTLLNSSVARFSSTILDEKRSVISTVEHLINKSRYFVAFMIFLFSVLIPLVKGLLLLLTLFKKNLKHRKRIQEIISFISKWSMADVFVMAVFLAFLSTTDSGVTYNTTVTVMGMNLPVSLQTVMKSGLGPGFYYFLSYCLSSMVAAQLANKIKEDQ